MTDSKDGKICRLVIQQCVKAHLNFDTEDTPVGIGQGIVVFICFLQGATLDHLNNIVKAVVNAKLSEPPASKNKAETDEITPCCHDTNSVIGNVTTKTADDDGSNLTRSNKRQGSRDSVLQCDLDVLIIPQATLGGKLKGKNIQYHGNVEKGQGQVLFETFVEKVKEAFGEAGELKVKHGVYGARQILSMETNGPFTHIFEF